MSTATVTNPSASLPLTPLLSVENAAIVLGISERTLSTLTERRAFPSVTIGRRRLYRAEDLTAYINQNITGGR